MFRRNNPPNQPVTTFLDQAEKHPLGALAGMFIGGALAGALPGVLSEVRPKLRDVVRVGRDLKETSSRWQQDLTGAARPSLDTATASYHPSLVQLDADKIPLQGPRCIQSGTDQFCSSRFHPSVQTTSSPSGQCFAITSKSEAAHTPAHGYFCQQEEQPGKVLLSAPAYGQLHFVEA
jgi:hypothetical protein